MKIKTLFLCLLAAALAACGPVGGKADPGRPNIVLIMVDDLGPEWVGCCGSAHQTPNIDRLAAEGLRFETAWATPLCTPTRNVLLTGRYPFRTGWTEHHDTPRWGGQHLDWNREITFARLLRDAGYATAIAGKWQINDLRTHPDCLRQHGFDEHCVWPGFEKDAPREPERFWDPLLQINGERPRMKERYGPEVMAEFLVDFIKRNRNRPFLAYYPMVLVHSPFVTTPLNKETKLEGKALFPGMVTYMDRLVGRVVGTLDELGIRERTIVIFTTDNGTTGAVTTEAWGRKVKGGKGGLREAGIHVPFIVSWPGRVRGGRTTDVLVDFSDILPTLCELAGAKLPEGVAIDGRSFVPTLVGMRDLGEREWIFSQLNKDRAVRDKRFKLTSDGKFYDLWADPAETTDISANKNEGFVAAQDRLRAALQSLPPDAKLPFEPVPRPRQERK